MGQKVTLTYEATLNDLAANDTGRPGDSRMMCGWNFPTMQTATMGSTGFTPWDTVVCFTYRIDIVKTNDHDKVLQGAHFRLYSDKDEKRSLREQGDTGYHVINRDSQEVRITQVAASHRMRWKWYGADGQVIIIGLGSGNVLAERDQSPGRIPVVKRPIECKPPQWIRTTETIT